MRDRSGRGWSPRSRSVTGLLPGRGPHRRATCRQPCVHEFTKTSQNTRDRASGDGHRELPTRASRGAREPTGVCSSRRNQPRKPCCHIGPPHDRQGSPGSADDRSGDDSGRGRIMPRNSKATVRVICWSDASLLGSTVHRSDRVLSCFVCLTNRRLSCILSQVKQGISGPSEDPRPKK